MPMIATSMTEQGHFHQTLQASKLAIPIPHRKSDDSKTRILKARSNLRFRFSKHKQMAAGSGIFKLLRPSLRPQSTDMLAAVTWGIAGITAGLWLVQPFDWLKKQIFEKPAEE